MSRKSSTSNATVGDRVFIKGQHYGVVRFIGKTSFDSRGEWVGVELETPDGKNNGTVKGKTYFSCRENYGIFVRHTQVERAAETAKPAPSGPTSSPRGPSVSGAEALFAKYREADDETAIGPEGVAKFCDDLGIAPDDFRILVLAWKLNAAKMGYFSREEFVEGLKSLKCLTLDQLKRTLDSLERSVRNTADDFSQLYNFAFSFCRETAEAKCVDVETAAAMIQLLLRGRPHAERFGEFLRKQTSYKMLNKDQWACFYSFATEVKEDLSNHDETAAWPSILDEYVEYVREN